MQFRPFQHNSLYQGLKAPAGGCECLNRPPELVKEAKELGLNISKITENALREYIRRLKGSNEQKDCNRGLREVIAPL
ncbi:hypothetical protein DRO49_05770 [Candidatus Bathyarchaeota archaeon]|nr:MAG: hypothetical protein DRO49_05770 [Candidatus Bathyarchaeota archaeon]